MPDDSEFDAIDWHRSQTLQAFLASVPALSRADQTAILDAAGQLIADHYAHLPHKRAAHGIDLAARLRALGRALPTLVGETSFHAELARLFAELRDLHTIYTLPAAYADRVAFLPFQLGRFLQDGAHRVIVTHVMPGAVPPSFVPGIEVLAWNGVPIARALERMAVVSGGANPPASRARALAAMTQRPMLRMAPPDEMWVEVEFLSDNGEASSARFEWRVCRLIADAPRPAQATRQAAPEAAPSAASLASLALGLALDEDGDALRLHRKAVFAPLTLQAERAGLVMPAGTVRDGHPFEEEIPTTDAKLRAWRGTIAGQAFGHLRIRSFVTAEPDAYLAEIRRLLSLMPESGVVIDVRDNPGGLVSAAERLLQFFTDTKVEPMRMQFLASDANLALCRAQTPDNPDMSEDLSRWIPSLERAQRTGAIWSSAFPMTDPEQIHAAPRAYAGPVVLVTSALSYSATDMFIAGFRDNGIGPILGVDENSGAGGANRWKYSDILCLQRGERLDATPPTLLPGGADLRVAIRRALRVGNGAGTELEEAGILPDEVHSLTRADLLAGDADLIAHAVRLMHGVSG